MQNILSF